MNKHPLTWVEISENALKNNVSLLRSIVGEHVLLAPCVKGNAYGHDLLTCAKIFADFGADWLCVNALFEAKKIRTILKDIPILVLGYIQLHELQEAVENNVKLVVYNTETLEQLEKIGATTGKEIDVHVKAETGNNRQGLKKDELVTFCKEVKKKKHLRLEGIYTHFANIEDTTDHSYAMQQLQTFHDILLELENKGIVIPIKHCANSAATLLFSETHFNMVRPGIASYGLWPSNETYVSYLSSGKSPLMLSPALAWKTKIAQVKEIDAGQFIGYGCTYKTTHQTRLAILPIGYYDGYDRKLSNQAYVLIHGKRAPIRGRVCMNIVMVDVTDIPDVHIEDEVVLLGSSGSERITAEQLGNWTGSINYEDVTRIRESILRISV
ncbi:MAG: alanine racemase [Candidatus Magasanikbacteria bacterium CG11_big_fil_rev_8_21_14_0_20_39_34]|uniref:Alanine racemase n=1 Tax=Candidatus Magasanikbacteria bacterium CG11_big_fil_rev_8_21_14_0_20_39_34 TaxID=1974653 RepID=A0A2H0N5H3_9BACT|nr:MAG: alanine racemase [Candidatus Magasanikbacteria bacterium CG11_big_fil_rev_8_21_14_0_20_39_34]